jgi:allantoinase
VVPGNSHELKALVRHGVRGFKSFLIDSGVEEFPAISEDEMGEAMMLLSDEPTTFLFHAEMDPYPPSTEAEVEVVAAAAAVTAHVPPDSPDAGHNSSRAMHEYREFLACRPPSLELRAIKSIIAKAHLAPNLPLHIVHLSSADAIPLLRRARASGIRLTAETCSHYLALAAEEVQAGDTRYKCCPPIRESENQDRLWLELLRPGGDSVIRTVVSDHSPCTPDLKNLPPRYFGHNTTAGKAGDNAAATETSEAADEVVGDFSVAWGGISSVGMTLCTLWTEMKQRGLVDSPETADRGILDIVRWCCERTALQVGLEGSKGSIRVGMDADLCVFSDKAKWTVEPSTLFFRNKVSPYQGKVMNGVVRETWLRGRRIFVRDDFNKGFVRGHAEGQLLLEPRIHRHGGKMA